MIMSFYMTESLFRNIKRIERGKNEDSWCINVQNENLPFINTSPNGKLTELFETVEL